MMMVPQDDLADSSWSSSPLVLLREIHDTLVSDYDYKDSAPSQSRSGPGAPGVHISQDGISQQRRVRTTITSFQDILECPIDSGMDYQ